MRLFVTGTRGIPNIMGGVETHCEELYPRIAHLDVDVTIARRSSYVHDQLKEWNDVKLINIPTPKKKSIEAIVHTFRAIIKAKQQGVEIVHIHAIGPALMTPLAKMLGMKVVFTHHGPDYDRDKWGFAAKQMLKLGEWFGCKFADHVIVISDVIRKHIALRCGRTQDVHLIYNGVTTPEICDYPDYFAELGIEKGKYILAACRFVPEKNLHHLVEAFLSLGDTHGVKLVLAGDTDFEDDYSRNLKRQASETGIVLTGFIKGKKLHSLLSNALCYCLPSSHEGLPIALLEAMSYNLPVVVSDIPANSEIGLSGGCYFHVGNSSELGNKLKREIQQGMHREYYDMSKYNWDNIAQQVNQVYNSL